jgi:hypothetical protein
MHRFAMSRHTSFLQDRRIVLLHRQGGRTMKTVLSYCSARMFLKGLLPMVAMSPRQSGSVRNDNDLQRHIGFSVEPSNQRGSTPSLCSERAASGLNGHVVAALALVTGILALPLLQGLVVPATTASGSSSDIIRGSTIAPTLLEPYEDP